MKIRTYFSWYINNYRRLHSCEWKWYL